MTTTVAVCQKTQLEINSNNTGITTRITTTAILTTTIRTITDRTTTTTVAASDGDVDDILDAALVVDEALDVALVVDVALEEDVGLEEEEALDVDGEEVVNRLFKIV